MNYFSKRILSLWIYLDVTLHLKIIEKNIKKGTLKIPNKFKVKRYKKFIEYSEFFISDIYSDVKYGRKKLETGSICSLAESISNLFIESYIKGEIKKDKKKLMKFFPRGEIINHFKIDAKNRKKESLNNILRKGSVDKVTEGIFSTLENNEIDIKKRKKKLIGFIPLPSPMHYIAYLLDNCKIIINDIKHLSKKYNIIYNSDGETRCFYNAMNISLHFFCLYGRSHLTKKERLLVFALSALHPAQDDLIDDIGCKKSDALAISEAIKGKKLLSVSNSARSIIDLIKIIYKYLPPKKHPMLVQILSELHDWQLKSKAQKNKQKYLSKKDLLNISFMKGGYAFAFYGYVSQGSMSKDQFSHYFSMGAIFQIMDDLHDINDDLKSNTKTVFTEYINRNENIDNAMHGFINMQHCFEKNIIESKHFKYPTLIRFIELFGARYDTFRFYNMHKNRCSKNFNENILYQFPFDIKEISNFFSHTREHETIDNYMNIILDIERRAKENSL